MKHFLIFFAVFIVWAGVVSFAVTEIAPSVERAFYGIVDRIDHTIGYEGG